MNVEQTANIILPADFKKILNQFEQRFQGEGFSTLASYIGFDWVLNKDEVRGYELVPFEAELPFDTGSNGEHMGWLNLCPDLDDFKKPFISWAPLGHLVFYHGCSIKEILENSIKYSHAPGYDEIDLKFLSELGIDPNHGKEILMVNYDDKPLNKIPLELPEDYRYELTSDGVGVVDRSIFFSQDYDYCPQERSFEMYLKLARENMDNSFFASALFFLKEAYYKNFYEDNKQVQILEVLKLKEVVYNELGMADAASLVKNEIATRDLNI